MLTDQVSQGVQSQPQIDATIANTSNVHQNQSTIWSAFIPRINKIFLVLSLVFVFGIDLTILISSSFSLIGFWLEMLLVFGVFLPFFCFENFILSKKFAGTKSRLDLYIAVGVVFRNLAIFLNFIPFIQLIGVLILGFAGIPYLIIYLVLLWFRSKANN